MKKGAGEIPPFPGGKRFAFTVVDDTDVATVENVRPVYDLLHELGMRTTKTVWPLPYADPASNFISSETLADTPYLEFVRQLQERGFEITWHCATMESSERDQTLLGLETFHREIGHYPRVHVNHSMNRENLYWGADRVDFPPVRMFVERVISRDPDYYQGHVPGSRYWWGDECRRHVQYCRNLTFSGINLARINPSMPYPDPRRPLVPLWFSASDAEDVDEFRHLLRPSNIERLDREGGFCIVATHFGKGFVRDGEVDPDVRASLENLAGRNGWFPTAGELLDWLRDQRRVDHMPGSEWRAMQIRWLTELIARRLKTIAGKKLKPRAAATSTRGTA